MRDTTVAIIHALIKRYPQLSVCHSALQKSVDTLLAAFHQNHKLLVCGNGGSAADCEHIVGELMKGFLAGTPFRAQKTECKLRACIQKTRSCSSKACKKRCLRFPCAAKLR